MEICSFMMPESNKLTKQELYSIEEKHQISKKKSVEIRLLVFTPGGVTSQGSDKGLQPGIDELCQALHGPRSVHQRVEVPPPGPQPPPLHLQRPQPQAVERQD